MASPYTPVPIVNYNAGAPSNDGQQNAQNETTWDKHKTKLGDPLFDAVDQINTELVAAFDSVVAHYTYDMPFNAGYSPTFAPVSLVVQTYGEMIVGRPGSFTGETGFLEVVATGSNVEVDIEKNNVSIYTTKPIFAASSTNLTSGTLKTDGTEDFVFGDRITFKVTAIGSTIAGAQMRFTSLALIT